jgi:predicted TIM-barrel fold metal-dependent hydrolase
MRISLLGNLRITFSGFPVTVVRHRFTGLISGAPDLNLDLFPAAEVPYLCVRQNAKCVNKKKPHEYLRDQVLADSMVFSPEGIRHLVAEMGPGRLVYGTDMPFVWPDAVDAILQAPIPDAQKEPYWAAIAKGYCVCEEVLQLISG